MCIFGQDTRKAPWFQIKEDPQVTAKMYVISRVVDNLKTILPHAAQQLHSIWATTGSSLAHSRWWNTRRKHGRTKR